jgi:hypothetical protein
MRHPAPAALPAPDYIGALDAVTVSPDAPGNSDAWERGVRASASGLRVVWLLLRFLVTIHDRGDRERRARDAPTVATRTARL